jgi:hypothetical protein
MKLRVKNILAAAVGFSCFAAALHAAAYRPLRPPADLRDAPEDTALGQLRGYGDEAPAVPTQHLGSAGNGILGNITPEPRPADSVEKEWLVMAYINGRNNLWPHAVADVNEMERTCSWGNMHVVAQLGLFPAHKDFVFV